MLLPGLLSVAAEVLLSLLLIFAVLRLLLILLAGVGSHTPV